MNNNATSTQTERKALLTGLFNDKEASEKAYYAAISRGYTNADINLLMSDDTKKKYFLESDTSEFGSKALEGAGTGSAIGGTIGAVVGGIAAIGTNVLLPGFGLIVAGHLVVALAGLGAGGLAGGLVGALVGWGFPEDRAVAYEAGLKAGKIMVGVHPRNEEDASYFENEWRNNKGEEIYR